MLAVLCVIVWGCAVATIPGKPKEVKVDLATKAIQDIEAKRNHYQNEYIKVKLKVLHKDKFGAIYSVYNPKWELEMPFYFIVECETEDKILIRKNKETFIRRFWLENMILGCSKERAKKVIKQYENESDIKLRQLNLLLFSYERFEFYAIKEKTINERFKEMEQTH